MYAYLQQPSYMEGKKLKLSSLCCILASLILVLILWGYISGGITFSSNPLPINSLYVLILFFFGSFYAILGIMINRTYNEKVALITIVISLILLTATPLFIKFNPFGLSFIIIYTPPSAILGLSGGLLGIREARAQN